MEKLIIFLAAFMLIILGARGTYKAVWNQFFPGEPIVTTPVSTLGTLGTVPGQNVPGSGVPKGASSSQNQAPSGYATNPNEVGQQAAQATQQWINGVLSGASTGATNGTHVVTGGSVYNPEIIGQSGGQYRNTNPGNTSKTGGTPYTGQAYASNKPSWWPSWLPWPGDIGVSLAR